jgi:hypothetical protein
LECTNMKGHVCIENCLDISNLNARQLSLLTY